MRGLLNLFFIIAVGFGIYGVLKDIPEGVSLRGAEFAVPASSITFFEDRTYVTDAGFRVSEQEIFDEIFAMIDGAQEYVLVDMFLFNDFLGTATTSYRALSGELTQKLIAKRTSAPGVPIVLITDPINEIYGGYTSEQLNSLRDAGVHVVVTDLLQLRDSNPLWSAFYRAYVQWFDNEPKEGRFPNPFDERLQKLSLRTYLSLFNFKANHRKVVLADTWTPYGKKFSTLVTSANPHDGSSAHTNTAVRVDDFIWKDVLESELAVAALSGVAIPTPPQAFLDRLTDRTGDARAQLLTEGKIREAIITEIKALQQGDELDLAMFYLSDRKVVDALKKADARKVAIRVLLDPNKDAFGREKNGIPNRQVATELVENTNGSTEVRFCDTHGEQCHTKMLLTRNARTGEYVMLQGSANFTRRNIGDYNLETNILVRGTENMPALSDATRYFNAVWNNEPNKTYSTVYETYKDTSTQRKLLYRFMEDLGTSSF